MSALVLLMSDGSIFCTQSTPPFVDFQMPWPEP
jgi:hypothetical protein